jgi:hypothetical protein
MKAILAAAVMVNFLASAPALAAFTLANDNGGDGFVQVDPLEPRIFTLFSANNAPDINNGFSNLTTYGDVSSQARLVNVRWRHVTADSEANWDAGGWFLNGSFFQLTDDSITTGIVQGGSFQILLNPGDNWGFYVNSTDSFNGRGELTISSVPEPQSWAMLILGFGLVGAVARRRNRIGVIAA